MNARHTESQKRTKLFVHGRISALHPGRAKPHLHVLSSDESRPLFSDSDQLCKMPWLFFEEGSGENRLRVVRPWWLQVLIGKDGSGHPKLLRGCHLQGTMIFLDSTTAN